MIYKALSEALAQVTCSRIEKKKVLSPFPNEKTGSEILRHLPTVPQQVSGRIGPGHLVLWTSRSMGPGVHLLQLKLNMAGSQPQMVSAFCFGKL